MRKTAAWNVMGVERSTQAIAEEAARRAGMSLAHWLDEVVAEQAAEQGVATEDLSENDRLDAIGERLDQLSRQENDSTPALRRQPRASQAARATTSAESEIAAARLEAAMAKFDLRASRNEQRTAKALESVAQWIERSENERAREAAGREGADREALRRARYAAESRDDLDDRLAPEPRRAEPEAPRSRLDLQDAVARIHRRRGELDARQGFDARVASERPAPRGEIEEARAARATPSRVASFPARPRPETESAATKPQTNVAVEELRDEIAGLHARLDQFGRERIASAPAPQPAPVAPPADRRLTSGETEGLRAEVTAMRRALMELAPRNANVALEGAVVDLGQRLEAMRKSAFNGDALRPLEDMLRQVMDLLRRQDPQSAAKAVENDLKVLSGRIEALTRAAVDPEAIDLIRRQTEDVRQMLAKAATSAPLAKLERQIETLADRADRLFSHPAPQPEIERLVALFSETRSQIERAVSPAFLKSVEQRLESLSTRIDEALKRPAPIFDARPIEELAHRFDTLRSVVEKQREATPATAKLEAALADIGRKLDRPLPIPAVDPRPFEDLASRVDHLKSAFERQAAAAPVHPKLEAALADIGRKLDRPSPVPTLDVRPFEEIARRVEGLKSIVERQAAIPAATDRLEATLAEIGQKLERLAASPPVDSRPLDDLARRFDTLTGAVERQAAAAPANSNLDSALAELSRKLDRPVLAPAFDARPLDKLAQQVESLRTAVERQAETAAHSGKLEAAITEIGRKLDRPPQGLADQMAIKSTLQALSARVEDGFRKIGSAPPDSGKSVGALELELLDEIARGLEEVRGSIDRQADFSASAIRLETAIDELANRMEDAREPASDRAALNETLQMLLSRLRDWSPSPAATATVDDGALRELTNRFDALHASLASHSDIAPQLSHLSTELAEIRERMVAQGQYSNDARVLVEIIQDLSNKIDQRDSSASDLRALETLAREVLAKPMRVDTSSIESMIGELGQRIDAAAGANFDLGPLVDWMSKIDSQLGAVDPAPVELAIRELGERIEARESVALDSRQIEQAADLIAQRLESRPGLGDDAELLLRHLSEIHERLDGIGGGSGSSAALEKSVADLVAEFDSTRQLLASIIEPAARASGVVDDIAYLKAEYVSAERRMTSQLIRVQEILEQLSDRLRRIEEGQEEPVRPSNAPAQASAPTASGFDFKEIPDRPRDETMRPALAPAAPPQAARALAEPSGFLLEPGAGAPRAAAKKPEEPRRAMAEETEPAPSTDLQAHIAAARRAAMAEMNARREQTATGADSKRAASPIAALKQAQSVVASRRVPFLIGATLLVAAATAAVFEMRGGRMPLIQKSEIVPAIQSPLAQAPARPAAEVAAKDSAPNVDFTPTGAVNPAKATDDAAKTSASASRAPADLVAALPAGQPDALKAAAVAGDANAETEMGLRYVEGRALARDPKTGARWLELAANQGVIYAQYRIGALYERGVGVGKDSQLARAWYKKAADGGNARALHNLAVMDAEDGGNGKPDYVAAAAGFRAAGEFGVRDSQYNLGVLYGRGLGLAQDLAQSWMWFSLAAQQGDVDAGKKRDEVAAKMDATQLAAAAKLLADFKPKTPTAAANEAPQPSGVWDAKAPAPQAAKPAASPTPTIPAVKS